MPDLTTMLPSSTGSSSTGMALPPGALSHVIDVERCRLVARVYKDAEHAKAAGAEEPRYVSHLATCPQSSAWRRT